jgi:uncharacterized protein YkwD
VRPVLRRSTQRAWYGCALALFPALASADAGVPAPPTNPWAEVTASPRAGAASNAGDAAIAAACGGGIDGSLATVAAEVVQSLATHGALPDAQEIEWRQRKAGSPHVWPRTWGAHVAGPGSLLDRKALAADVKKWLGKSAPRVRCGVASYATKGVDAVAVIAVDPLADLAALPTHVKEGAWIDVDATLLGDATEGRVVLLPPSGKPKTILASTSEGPPEHVKAKALLGAPGLWVVQVLASDANGPRPVLEAEVWAGMDPPLSPPSPVVPGEDAGEGIADPADALFARLNGARAAEGIGAVKRDATLDQVARDHAEAMRAAKLLAHDAGDGDPAARVAATGTTWKLLGENVAKAKTDRAANRALYASPSHRGNMLDARFKKVGVGVAIDPKSGEMWVAQLFGG